MVSNLRVGDVYARNVHGYFPSIVIEAPTWECGEFDGWLLTILRDGKKQGNLFPSDESVWLIGRLEE